MGILIWEPKEIDQLIDFGKNGCLFRERLLTGAAAAPDQASCRAWLREVSHARRGAL